ncbi:hypothetical protein SDC9_70039 [bioreactor metagenome]|uniref:Fumarate reductase/succinate dehydrogenase flavoprotein-like C-terminal domain-containing protein n=1 Tax=bioreactor metagenome TaxID=1076179 RepID=A0A644Y4T4_9ZZZZ
MFVSSDSVAPSASNDEVAADKLALKELMSDNFGAVRHMADMNQAYIKLNALFDKYERMILDTPAKMELCNMTEVARRVAKGAIDRKVSVGAHYIEQ